MSRSTATLLLILFVANPVSAMPMKGPSSTGTSTTATAEPIPIGKVLGCNELAAAYQTEMTVPYKTFSDARVRKCVKRQSVTSLNIPLFIATAFYDRSLNERAKALGKLRAYSCATENTCKRLFGFVDAHLKATILTKTKESVELFTQLDSLRAKLHYDLNSID